MTEDHRPEHSPRVLSWGPSEESDRHFERYFRVLARSRWSPEDFERLLGWAPPEKLEAILKELGPPEEALEVITALKERSADWAWMKTGKQKVAFASKVIIGAGLTVTVLRPLWQMFLDWMQK